MGGSASGNRCQFGIVSTSPLVGVDTKRPGTPIIKIRVRDPEWESLIGWFMVGFQDDPDHEYEFNVRVRGTILPDIAEQTPSSNGPREASAYVMESHCRTVCTSVWFDGIIYTNARHYVSLPRMLFICFEVLGSGWRRSWLVVSAIIGSDEITPKTVLYTLPFSNYQTNRGVVCLGTKKRDIPLDELVPAYFSTAFESDWFTHPLYFWNEPFYEVATPGDATASSFSELARLTKEDPKIGSRICLPPSGVITRFRMSDWIFRFGDIIFTGGQR